MERMVVYYGRVSTGRQAESGLGMAAQRAAAEGLMRVRGMEVRAWFCDEGVSGAKRERPELEAALEGVCATKGVLVVYSLSRLARSTRHLLEIADRLRDAGADLVSVTEQIDTTTPVGKFTFTVLAAVAEFERALTAERTKAALAEAKKRGVVPGPKGEDNPEVLERVLEAHLLEMPLSEIAAGLSKMGYRTARGAKFTHVQVRRMVNRAERAELVGARSAS